MQHEEQPNDGNDCNGIANLQSHTRWSQYMTRFPKCLQKE